jgi:hypothetical protein
MENKTPKLCGYMKMVISLGFIVLYQTCLKHLFIKYKLRVFTRLKSSQAFEIIKAVGSNGSCVCGSLDNGNG